MLVRDLAAAPGHFIATYDSTNSSHVSPARDSIMDCGSPVSVSNSSPRLTACSRSDRKLSARARVTNVFERARPATPHRTILRRMRATCRSSPPLTTREPQNPPPPQAAVRVVTQFVLLRRGASRGWLRLRDGMNRPAARS